MTTAPERQVRLAAPVSGTTIPLADIPDPVFSSGAVGDGASLPGAGVNRRGEAWTGAVVSWHQLLIQARLAVVSS